MTSATPVSSSGSVTETLSPTASAMPWKSVSPVAP